MRKGIGVRRRQPDAVADLGQSVMHLMRGSRTQRLEIADKLAAYTKLTVWPESKRREKRNAHGNRIRASRDAVNKLVEFIGQDLNPTDTEMKEKRL